MNGIGVGLKVNLLIMTLGMASVLLGVVTVGLVGDGFLSGSTRPCRSSPTSPRGPCSAPCPGTCSSGRGGRRPDLRPVPDGLGRTIYAVGDNPVACRLAGVRIWQVLLAVYVMSALLAALAGLLFSGHQRLGRPRPDQLLPAALGGGRGHRRHLHPRRGRRLHRHHPRALILTVLNRLLLTLDTTEAFRQILYGLIVLALAWVYVRITGQRGA